MVNTMIRFSLVVFFFSLIFALNAQPILTRTYKDGPLDISQQVTLHFQVFKSNNSIRFGLIYNDSSTFNTNSTVWAGLGIGEPTSGSMLGADVLTVHFKKEEFSSCSIIDRYVPFTAYPLTEQPGPFPLPDDCSKPDWTLVNCERDPSSGLIIIEVDRPLVVADKKQDRSIEAGESAFLYAYGNEFSYHGKRRESTKVIFYSENDDESSTEARPNDIDGFFDVLATNYTIPSRSTTYACTTLKAPIPKNSEGRMIVGAEPIIEPNLRGFVHHFTLFLCAGEEYARQTKETVACDGDNPPFGPLGNGNANCSTMIYGYAKGVTEMFYPKDVGVLLQKERPYMVMETHFDNPTNEEGVLDNSGIRLLYTNTKRKHMAGSILLGDSFVTRTPQLIVSGYRYQHTCPSVCTERLLQPINLFSSFLHMHTTGKEIYTNIYSKNGTFKQNYNKVNFWSDAFQQNRIFKESVTLNPGDQIQVSCVYDTSKRPTTEFGSSTAEEMCMEFILYWPLQVDKITGHEINSCNFLVNGTDLKNITFCGDNGKVIELFQKPEIFPFSINPAFNDTVGAPTEFGASGAVCRTPAAMPTMHFSQMISQSPGPTISNEILEETIIPSTEPNVPVLSATSRPSESEEVELASSPNENQESDPEASTLVDERTCFPSHATVVLENGKIKRMEELKVGDKIIVGLSKNKKLYSSVFMFTHFNRNIKYEFVHLQTSLNKSISLTKSHYIYANDRLTLASNVKVGDKLRTVVGDAAVEDIKFKIGRGLFNPQTTHGDIVVDGIVASTFTKAVESSAAIALLTPLRWGYRFFGLDSSFLFAEV